MTDNERIEKYAKMLDQRVAPNGVTRKPEDWEKEADEEIAEIIRIGRKRKRIEDFFSGYCFG